MKNSSLIYDRYNLGLPIILTITCIVYGLLLGIISDTFVFDEINVITILSVILFVITLIYSCISDKHFSLVLPFIFIALPTAVNNIIPGVYLESKKMEVICPLFCHTELFLIFAILTSKGFRYLRTDKLTFIICLSFLLTSIVNIMWYMNSHYSLLLISGQYPVRLLLLSAIVVRTRKIYIDKFLIGVCIAVLFLSLESTVNTIVSGLPFWASGSLGNNTFGNVMGQMSMMLIFYLTKERINGVQKWLFVFSIIIGITITILTDTRMAMLAMLLVSIVLIFPLLSKKVKICSVIFVILIIGYVVKNDVVSNLSGKMDVNSAIEAVDFSSSSGVDIQYSEATTSIITRLKLWGISTDMFLDRPLTGIGWNLFNVLKYKYGFDIIVIIDPHNGYFSFISQLGIWGILWIFFLYYRSWKIYLHTENRQLKTLLVFNMGMSICEFTNAGTYKFSVLTMLVFISVYVNYIYYRQKKQINYFSIK